MRLIGLAVVVAVSLTLAAPGAVAEPAKAPSGRPWRVGILLEQATGRDAPYLDAILQGLGERGYVEGQNLAIVFRSAEGNVARAPQLAADLTRIPVDVIMASGLAGLLAAKDATTTIPIVMMGLSYPVERGLIVSASRPGGNITGIASTFDISPAVKQLELLHEAVPSASRLGVLTTSSVIGRDALRWHPSALETARVLALTLIPEAVDAPDQATSALAKLIRQRVHALFADGTAPNTDARRAITEFALKHRLPLVSQSRRIVEAGGLLFYGPDALDLYRRSAIFVDKILNGARPGDLPVEQATKFELVINLKTAKAIGLTIPLSLLQRADQMIE
jgi:putative tryptophan/tyrosine transport system substrate-binding protein